MYLRESASRAFSLLAKNPPLFGRVLLAKANAMRPAPRGSPMRCRFGDVVFEIDPLLHPDAVAMYFGASSPLVVGAMRRHLHPDDTFIDVGANVGYLSAVGAALVGPYGKVHSFEPVSRYFRSLCRLVEINPSYTIVPNPLATGSVIGGATMSITRQPGQNTLVPGYKSGSDVETILEVPMIRLDSYIEAGRLTRVTLIKIDAEGFELPILEGLKGYFDRGHRPAIICEIAPRAYPLLGRKVLELSQLMAHYGYSARDIIDGTTPVDLAALKYVTDVLFVVDS